MLAVLLALGAWSAPGAAAAEDSPHVEVQAVPAEPQFNDWQPGTARYWSIRARVVGGTAQQTHLRLAGSGALVTDPQWGIVVQAWRCSRAYQVDGVETRPTCPGEETAVVVPGRLESYASSPGTAQVRATRAWPLPPATSTWQHLVVELRRPPLPDGAADTPQRSARFGVGIYASGDEPEIEPETETNPPPGGCTGTNCPTTSPSGGGLPDAGGPALWLLAAGAVLIATGASVVTRRRR